MLWNLPSVFQENVSASGNKGKTFSIQLLLFIINSLGDFSLYILSQIQYTISTLVPIKKDCPCLIHTSIKTAEKSLNIKTAAVKCWQPSMSYLSMPSIPHCIREKKAYCGKQASGLGYHTNTD